MNLRTWLLVLGLCLSLGGNFYLLNRLEHIQTNSQSRPTIQANSAVPQEEQGFTDAPNDDLVSPADFPISIQRMPADQQLNWAKQRQTWLHQNRKWLAAEQYVRVANFLQDYLKKYPQDMDFLILEGDLVAKTGLLSDAIIHYYGLLNLPMSDAQYTQVAETVQTLAGKTIAQLKQANSWDILAVFVEPLLQVAPTKREFILALSLAYAEQHQLNLMENTLAALDYYDPEAMAIRNIIQRQSFARADSHTAADGSSEQAGTVVDLNPYGDQYVVGVQLSGNSLNLLIDTGATTTAISRRVFGQLRNQYKFELIGRFLVRTANGNVMAPMYQFASLNINQATVENITVVVLPMQGMEHADGLLGMNFLREFEFRLDQKNAKLYLE